MTARAAVIIAVLLTFVPSFVPAAPARKAKTTGERDTPRVVKRTEPDVAAKTPASRVHEVQKGETLGAIARKYEITVASIVIANRLKGPRAKLSLGQRLTIPPSRPGATPFVRGRRGPVDEPLPLSLVLTVPDFEDVPSFRWPVEGVVTSTFGRRGRSWHRGLDVQAGPGTAIVASAAGVVIASGFEPRYGQRVKIEHEGGFVTVYAHNERNLVDVGQEVAAGQMIATVGRTGRATGEHVHFEIRYDGRVYNPLYLLPLPPRSVQIDLTAEDQPSDDD